jgi:hypothetical protein
LRGRLSSFSLELPAKSVRFTRGYQFHPEFKSTPPKRHPVFKASIRALAEPAARPAGAAGGVGHSAGMDQGD